MYLEIEGATEANGTNVQQWGSIWSFVPQCMAR